MEHVLKNILYSIVYYSVQNSKKVYSLFLVFFTLLMYFFALSLESSFISI